MQNIKDWPLFVQICFGIIFSVFAIAGFIEIPKFNQQQTTGKNISQEIATELVNVDIIVESDASKPLKNVEVRFVSKGSPEVRRTNTDGFTQIEIPSRDNIEITLSKEGFEGARHTLNLKNDANRTRTYYLKPQ